MRTLAGFLSCSVQGPLEDSPKMVAVNGKAHAQGEESRASEEGPKEGLPIMKTLLTPYTQGPERVKERLNVAELQGIAPFLGQTIIPQKNDKTFIEMARGVNVS